MKICINDFNKNYYKKLITNYNQKTKTKCGGCCDGTTEILPPPLPAPCCDCDNSSTPPPITPPPITPPPPSSLPCNAIYPYTTFNGGYFGVNADKTYPISTFKLYGIHKIVQSLPIGDYPSLVIIGGPILLTLDSIAVPPNIRLQMFSEPNYKGNIFLDVVGPKVIYGVSSAIKSYSSGVWGNDPTTGINLNNVYPESSRKYDFSGKIIKDNGNEYTILSRIAAVSVKDINAVPPIYTIANNIDGSMKISCTTEPSKDIGITYLP